jgi:DNA-binding NarL/FixJ family response regulator
VIALTSTGNSSSQTLKVLIASEVNFVRESLREVPSRQDAISVVAICAEASEAWRGCRELQPDIMLIDATLQDG